MMNIINGGAHADNNDRRPGIHGHAGGAETSRRPSVGAEIFHSLQGAQGRRPNTSVGDEGGFAQPQEQRRGHGISCQAMRRPATGWRRRRPRSGRRLQRAVRRMGTTRWNDESRTRSRRAWSNSSRAGPSTRSCRSRTAGRGRLGRLEGADRGPRLARCSSSATISSSPTQRPGAGDRQRRRQQLLVKVNQIGTLDGDPRRRRVAHRRLLRRDLPPLGRDRGRHDRRSLEF